MKKHNKSWLVLILVLLAMILCKCGGAPETLEPTETLQPTEQGGLYYDEAGRARLTNTKG